ncbi:MAG: CRISPR-associated endonuclease Cas2 [Ignavibacteriales bacterium]|nr:CRISPR-associated endonuclease Cas2 [Ignavibacteriales bacterium]
MFETILIWVQNSVFEGEVTESTFETIIRDKRYYKQRKDCVIIILLIREITPNVKYLGLKEMTPIHSSKYSVKINEIRVSCRTPYVFTQLHFDNAK